MRLGFWGGACGIGASCVLLELEEVRVIVDCGIRQGRGETLPDLAGLQNALGGAPPDAVVLTHAHLDHSGALPVLHRAFPSAPIVATHASAELVRILLHDAVKVMDLERDDEIPLYTADEVQRTLGALRPVHFDDAVPVGGGRIRLLPAGHILGAAVAVLEQGHRSVVVTGDISLADQQTICGMPVPKLRADAVVVESTYGDRLHASREAEERRLCQQVAAAVAEGGHVLVPAFAVGRAQEVLLILRRAMQAGQIPPFPVYADGMVRAVCAAYQHHPLYLQPRLRRQLLRGSGDLFFNERSGFEPIRSRSHRDEVIGGPPCCVVASSGMLAGGASPLYARAWAEEPRSLITITGYQDEEAPGRALLDLADGKSRQIALAGGALEVGCRVERYHLSAHADADEIVGLLRRMEPERIFVVHGERSAREALAVRLEEHWRGRVSLPEDGELDEPKPGQRRSKAFWQGPGIGQHRPLTAQALDELRDLFFVPASPRQRTLTVGEIAQAWFGEHASAEQVASAREALEQPQSAFEPDLRLPYRYRARAPRSPQSGPAPVAEVLAALDRLVPPETGLYKRSAHQAEHRFVLCFEFPDAQGPRVAAELERIAAATGWQLEIHPHPNQERLAAAARAALPPSCQLVRGPSLRLDEKRVALVLSDPPDDAEDRARSFQQATGWALVLEPSTGSLPAPQPVARADAAAVVCAQEARESYRRVFSSVQPELAPAKASFPEGAIVLHYPHPAMAEHHRELAGELSRQTGREVRAHPHPIHQKLAELVQSRLPEHWSVTRAPAYVPQQDRVRIRVWDLPSEEEEARVLGELEELLGCTLEVVCDDG